MFLDISTHITQCCTFLVKSYVHMISGLPLKKQKSTKVIKILEDSLKDFFTKRYYLNIVIEIEPLINLLILNVFNRDCLLPVSLFESLLSKVSWKSNMHLIQCILPYAFNDSIRWFRRSQAICMLASFYHNTRLLEQLKGNSELDEIENNLSEFIIKVISISFVFKHVFTYKNKYIL